MIWGLITMMDFRNQLGSSWAEKRKLRQLFEQFTCHQDWEELASFLKNKQTNKNALRPQIYPSHTQTHRHTSTRTHTSLFSTRQCLTTWVLNIIHLSFAVELLSTFVKRRKHYPALGNKSLLPQRTARSHQQTGRAGAPNSRTTA